jgi:hypothetical protein
MASEDRDALIEAAASAWRPRAPQGPVRFHPAWWDLDPPGRQAAYEVARQSRALEAALDPDGLSTTARAVMAKIRASARR